MNKRNQYGFGHVPLLLALVVVVGIGLVAWRVYDSGKSQDEPANSVSTSSGPRLYTDTAKKFTFSYPEDWAARYPELVGKDGQVAPEPDYVKVSRDVEVVPASGERDNVVRVTPGCQTAGPDGQTMTVEQSLKARQDQFHTLEELTINGYKAYYDKLNFKGDAESYADHTYVVTDGSNCVMFSYRSSWDHAMSNKKFDDSKNLPAYESLVKSIKFAS